ncbi:hypothetical protein [Streptomyces sp. NPDC057301]|uniref:hypothetical protein n=1 Tax=Streptomyces sp. NPDC057301 TaxID=3346093 RepID=UPI00362D0B46
MRINRRAASLLAAVAVLLAPAMTSACPSAAATTAAFTTTLGTPKIVPIPTNPVEWRANDSTFPYLRNSQGTANITFWVDGVNFRSTGQSLDTMGPINPTTSVLSGGAEGTWDGNGVWLMAAQRAPGNPTGRIYGFYHAEDHVFEGGGWGEWNSTGLATSDDDGVTWSKKGRIIGSPQPYQGSTGDTGKFGGVEANSVIYDEKNKRWLAIGHGSGFVSTDPNAAPGTWKGWDGDGFDTPMPSTTSPNLKPLNGLTDQMANSNITWNTYLNRFVMVWRHFGDYKNIRITTSADGVNWDESTVLFTAPDGTGIDYPQIIGVSSSRSGQHATLVYEKTPSTTGRYRDMIMRPIHFNLTAQ